MGRNVVPNHIHQLEGFFFFFRQKHNTCKSRQAHDGCQPSAVGRQPSAIQNSTTCHAKHKRNFKHAIFVDVDTLLFAKIAPAQKCIAVAAAAALCDTYSCQRWFWGRSPNNPHAFSPYDAMKHVPKGSRAMQCECRRCEVP
jgi:hypothetical protein